MRRRHRYGNRETRNTKQNYNSLSGISMSDFNYYNKTNKIIELEVLKNINLQFEKYVVGQPFIFFYTNKTFFEGRCFFKFYVDSFETRGLKPETIRDNRIELVEFGSGVNLSNIKIEDINQAKYKIKDTIFLSFIPSEKLKEYLDDVQEKRDYMNKHEAKYFTTEEELINYLIITENIITNYSNERDSLNDDMSFLFGVDISKLPSYIEESADFNYQRRDGDTFHIAKVIEKRIDNINYRIAITKMFDYYTYNNSFILNIYPESHEDYNYIDENRIYITSGNNKKTYYLDLGLIEMQKQDIIIYRKFYDILSRHMPNVLGDNKVITPQIYRFYRERFTGLLKFENKNPEVSLMLEKYSKLIKAGKEIKIEGMIISKGKVQVEGQNFCLEFPQRFLDVERNLGVMRNFALKDDIRYNFNELYESILKISELKPLTYSDRSSSEYLSFNDTNFTLNGMKIDIRKEKGRLNINGIFCRIEDVFNVLARAICYNDVDEYNKYIQDVSNIGWEWKRVIGTGLMIKLQNPLTDIIRKIQKTTQQDTTLQIRFSFLWDARHRTRVYLLLAGKKYLIKYKGKFRKEFFYPDQVMTLGELKLDLKEILDFVNDEMLSEIIDNAAKELEIIREKGKQLVEATILDIKAVEGKIQISGNEKYGYLFNGLKSKSEYFVDKKTLDVYKKVNGVWNRRCVVNDHSKQRIFEDWLANRLVNVYNEPTYIYTLHNI